MKRRRNRQGAAMKAMRIIGGVGNTVTALLLIVILTMFWMRFVGIQFYVVMSGSMEPEIHTGSLCFVNTSEKYEDIQEGEVIAYYNPSGTAVTHRAIRITEEGIETKGDHNQVSDGITVHQDNYIGKTVFSIAKAGYLLSFMQQRSWKIIVVTILLSSIWIGLILNAE